MQVFLTGASGFVGSAILTQLIRSRHEVTCLVRPGSEKKLPAFPSDRVTLVKGDLLDDSGWQQHMYGCDAVIHLVGIIRERPEAGVRFDRVHTEAAKTVIAASRAANCKRFIHMSALGARPGAPSPYQDTKGKAEELVKGSGLDWTIFQPSVIFGPKDEFVNQLARLIVKAPFVPVPGSGRYELQPVGLQNVADGFVRSLTTPSSIHQVYQLGGPRAYSYNRILDIIGEALGYKNVRKIHIPLAILRPVVKLAERFPAFPLTTPQLTMLLEGSTCNPDPFFRTFDMDPIPFPEGVRIYLKKPPSSKL